MKFKKGDTLCILNKKVEIRKADNINWIYVCWYIDNTGKIQEIQILPSEAKQECYEKNN
jgi:hypothetical protein